MSTTCPQCKFELEFPENLILNFELNHRLSSLHMYLETRNECIVGFTATRNSNLSASQCMAASLHMVKVNKNLITYADRILLRIHCYRYSGAPYHPRIDHLRYIDPHTRHTHLINRVTRRVKLHVL